MVAKTPLTPEEVEKIMNNFVLTHLKPNGEVNQQIVDGLNTIAESIATHFPQVIVAVMHNGMYYDSTSIPNKELRIGLQNMLDESTLEDIFDRRNEK